MRSQTRLRRHLEDGWTLEIPGVTHRRDTITHNWRPSPPTTQTVSVAIHQRMLTSMTETSKASVLDERVAIILPPIDIPPTAVLISPQGERWNAAGRGIIRRTAHRRPVHTVIAVRAAPEGNRPPKGTP